MFHPKVTGDTEKLNQEILAFTENAYYYIQNYSIKYGLDFDNFEAELKRNITFVWSEEMNIYRNINRCKM